MKSLPEVEGIKMIKELIYLGLGIANEILVTLYYIYVGKHSAIPASLLTVLISLLGFFVIGEAVVASNWTLVLFYAFGSALGCFCTIQLVKNKTKKKSKKKKN
jgi:hypothetical protein